MFARLEAEMRQIIQKLYGLADVEAHWERPQDPLHGDLSTAAALRIAKGMKKNPQDIAREIADAIVLSPSVQKADIAGPGYVNVWMQPAALLEALEDTVAVLTPQKTRTNEAPVIVEYSQPNIAKPLGIHHILSTVIGQAIVNFYKHSGFNVLSWNYLGDWGTQFGKLAVAYEKWGADKPASRFTLDELLSLYVRFHEEAEQDPSLEELGRAAFRKLEQGDVQLRAFREDVVAVTKASLADLYRRLHVSFDLDLGESFYEDKTAAVLEEGKKKNVFVEGEGGALIVEYPPEKNLSPYMVRKGDGGTLYSTRDLAQMRYRIDTYHPLEILIVTDIAQKMHFEQLIETCKRLEWDLPPFDNVLFGRMRFADKKMSTRKGNILKLEEVLDEAVKRAADIIKERGEAIQTDDPQDLAEMMGIGALIYGILSQNRKMDIVFDWDKMLSFEGNSAPYLQYTHARARSVLRKGGEEKKAPAPAHVDDLEPRERSLLLTLLALPHVLAEARKERLPHKLTNYLYQLCQEFNAFYNALPILQASDAQRLLRIALTRITADVIKTGASILTIRVPDRM